MQIDINKAITPDILSSFKVAVMCLDQQNTDFVQVCLQQGIHYTDISADYSFLSKVEQLRPTNGSQGATAVLSVGLAPGLTNLLALQASRQLDKVDEIHISIMLGLGDSHGRAAIEWTVDNLRQNFSTLEQGETVERVSFTDGRATDFGSDMGTRTAYRFNFADQHILQRTLQSSVATRLCFDSEWVTKGIAALKRARALRLLNVPRVRELMMNLLSSIQIGKPIYAVKVEARGWKQNKPALAECFLRGSHEADATAAAAAVVATKLYAAELPQGIYHIEEWFDYTAFEKPLTGVVEMAERLTLFPPGLNFYKLGRRVSP
ncbi:saccharopine dehydrogenase [Paenibacillus sp. P96]|uniref:Saccharopine dehydrogenase n=1 Tax=Paenibacillus zeirhizosphaerae TaxID=2987519 RepID=A0ABT9FSY6_9BACL|nr:saccharopine dehydrogenase [Paenibacillus sp. P96]MDP4097851.1 saccharopine dehydrogenase [Paenibacillus sp. P96]